jgi:hypothetical protein
MIRLLPRAGAKLREGRSGQAARAEDESGDARAILGDVASCLYGLWGCIGSWRRLRAASAFPGCGTQV